MLTPTMVIEAKTNNPVVDASLGGIVNAGGVTVAGHLMSHSASAGGAGRLYSRQGSTVEESSLVERDADHGGIVVGAQVDSAGAGGAKDGLGRTRTDPDAQGVEVRRVRAPPGQEHRAARAQARGAPSHEG